MATGALSSRAPADTAPGCSDGAAGKPPSGVPAACAASAAGPCPMGFRTIDCEIIGLEFPPRLSWLSASARMSPYPAHFGLFDYMHGWRMHHMPGLNTANCVATMRFRRGWRDGYDLCYAKRECEWPGAAREYRRRPAGAWAVEPRHSVANPPGTAAPVDDLSTRECLH